METKELIPALRLDAEWAHANEWETPIMLGDHLDAAADALAVLLSVTAERGALKDALSDMRFAYLNKDNPPHQFETDALKKANELLGPIGKEADHADS